MPRHNRPCYQHSMKKDFLQVESHGASSSGVRISRWCSKVFVLGLLLCLFAPQCTGAVFTCSTGCTCTPWKLNGDKKQNLTCSGITEVPKDGKEGADVFKLDISNNHISSIAKSDFQYFVNLVDLDLSYNQISSIPEDTFTNLTSLQTLSLAGNLNVSLDNDIFDYTTIEYLDISHMNLMEVTKDVFKHMGQIKEINLGYNNLTSLTENLFKSLPLEKVILKGNLLTEDSIGKNLFKKGDVLKTVDLSNNRISGVSNKFLHDADALTNLDLSNNLLTSLSTDVFDDVPRMETLNLNSNELTSLPANIFKENTNLSRLDVSSNQLTTIPTSIFDKQPDIYVDFSNNPFDCDCSVRDFLYELRYHASKAVLNEDLTKCTDTSSVEQVYLDFWDSTCAGNLGGTCTFSIDCMVRNSQCDTVAEECVCRNVYYDNNGDTVDGGLCKPRKELGESCTMAIMCLADYSTCTGDLCACQSAYYDSDDTAVIGGECLLKLQLYSSCNDSYQCAAENAECSNSQCSCSTGYYDFTNSGTCNGPDHFFSCWPDNSSTDGSDVHFTHAEVVTTELECQEYCFQQGAAHYVIVTHVCVCGNIATSLTTSCCPVVLTSCNSKDFISPNTELVLAGINITHVPQLYAGSAHEFSVTTTLPIIDQIIWNFGDSLTETPINSSSSIIHHTYTHAGLYWAKVKAGVQSVNMYEVAVIPVRVQVPAANLTTFFTATSNKADVSSDLTTIFATFAMGYDFSYYWSKADSNGVLTKKQSCPSGWTAHRYSCIKLVTSTEAFDDAQSACVGDGGTLLQIDFMEEITEIVTTLGAGSDDFYLGGAKVGGVWQWKFDGSRAPFSDIDFTTASYDCVLLQGSSQHLTTTDCTMRAKYACMSDPVSCPYGGEWHTNGYCYVLTSGSDVKSWENAQTDCETQYGGWLANITEESVHTTITNLLTSASVSEAWFGLSDRGVEGYTLWADKTSWDLNNGPYKPTVTSNTEDCFATTDTKTWLSDRCSSVKSYVCQYSENIERLTVPTFMNGVPDIGITNGNNLDQLVSTYTFTDSTILTDVYLFPGLIFTKPGSVRSWIFSAITLGSNDSYDISLHVYSPSCPSGYLSPPGTSDQFSSCIPAAPSSTTASSTCTDNQFFCYLSNQCKYYNESCTCNSEGSSASTCGSFGSMPTYTIIGQTQITVTQSGDKFYTVPAGDIPIGEFDVIGIQVPAGENVLKSENLPSGIDQQTVYKGSNTGWLDKGDTFPSVSAVKEDKTFYLQALFTQDSIRYLPQNLGYSSTVGNYDLSLSIIESASESLSILLEESVDDVFWVNPALMVAPGSTTSLGTVHTKYNTSIPFTVRVERGTNLESRWSFDNKTAAITFTDTCEATVAALYTTECNASLYWSNAPYATFIYNTNTVGNMTLTIDITNSLGLTQKELMIETQKEIAGVDIVLVTSSLIPNNVALNKVTHFATSITEGTGLTYQYTVGGLNAPSTNSSLHYNFTSMGTVNVEVLVSNILGSQSQSVTVYVKKQAELDNCVFLNTPYIAAVGIALDLTLQCDVTVGAEVQANWALSDRNNSLTGAVLTTTSTTHTFVEPVTFLSVQAGVQVMADAHDPFENVTNSTTVDVYNAIPSVDLTVSSYQVSPSDTINFAALVPSSPGSYGTVTFTFDFGDGSISQTSASGNLPYAFSSSGNYTVVVTASNGPSSQNYTKHIEVFDQVTNLTLISNGPKELNQMITLTASVASGNFLSYQFSSNEFNVTQSSPTFSFNFTSAADYIITLYCSNALSNMQTSITVYIMASTDIRIVSLNVNSNPVTGCLEESVNYQFSVSIIHFDASNVLYDWDFGNGVKLTGTTGSTQNQGYTSAGNFTVIVTAKYAAAVSEISKTEEICVQEKIRSPSIQISTPVGLHASSTVTENVTVDVSKGTGLYYDWSTNATAGSSNTNAIFPVTFNAEGWYEISVTVHNDINSESLTKLVQVIEEISDLTISCGSCTEKLGDLYILNATNHVFDITISSGTGVTYAWDFGDTTSASGTSNTHTYNAIGQYNLTVTGQNPVTNQITYILVHVEVPLTDVTLTTYQFAWEPNINLIPNFKNHDILETAVIKADVQPAGMDNIDFIWTFDTGMTPITNDQTIGYYNYSTTGLKSCTVNATGSQNTVTSNVLQFYVIEKVDTINVTGNDDLLSTNKTFIVATNENYTFNASSSQIVPDTGHYFYTIKKGYTLVGSSTGGGGPNPAIAYSFRDEDSYELKLTFKNSLGKLDLVYTVKAIKKLSGPYITTNPAGSDGNITLGSSLTLTGNVLEGKDNVNYSWFYAVTPLDQLSSNNQNVTITPGVVGIYIITLEVYNAVTPPQSINNTVNVVVGITGASVDVVLPFPDAVKQGTTLSFTGKVIMGTDLSYMWEVFQTGILMYTNASKTFEVTFFNQAEYNVTLLIENYASSGAAYMEISSQYEVPAFDVVVTGSTYVNSTNKHALKTGDSVHLSSNILNTDFLQFDWKVDNYTEATTETYLKYFTSPAEYTVQLTASNKISDGYNTQVIIVQDPITGLNVQFCHATFELASSVTLVANTGTGTGVNYHWEGDGLTGSSSVHAVSFASVGTYSVNVTANNYISNETEYCMLTIQGRIGNLALSKSHYSFILFPVTFTVTGDYLDPANFTWKFSNSVTLVTTVPTVDQTFSNEGPYTVTVVVSNAVSSDNVSMAFTIEDFVCIVPVLSVYGSSERTTFRQRAVEFAVSVSTGGCKNYTSVYVWKLYTASSCSAPLNDQYILDDSIETSTPVLQLSGATLPYGTYCVEFKHSYANTPVDESKFFNLTIEASDLKALISGGDETSISEGTTFTLDARESYDPDNTDGTNLTYSWFCSESMATASAIDVCNQINVVTVANMTLTGLTLTAGDVYNITVTVSAVGRRSDSKSQQKTTHVSGTPIVSTKCISCIANGHFMMTSTKSMSVEGTCLSGCTSATSYQWLVTEIGTSNIQTTIPASMTTTGLNSINLVLKANALQADIGYTFELEATKGTATGQSSFSLPTSSYPSGGTCTVVPTFVTPLQDVTVSCQNFHDSDLRSGIYYEVLISSNVGTTEKYLAYYGSRAENQIFVAPFQGTSLGTIQVEVNVRNDYGASTLACSTTVAFNSVTLSGLQNDTVDVIVDEMVNNMKAIRNQNNPQSLVQYSMAVLNFLNEQSSNGVGLSEKRTAVREVIANSLAGLPRTSIHNIQQLSSAIKYLTAYPDELSSDTLGIVNVEIESLAKEMEAIVTIGDDQTDVKPDNLLIAVNKFQEALRQTSFPTSDNDTLLKFGDLDDYVLDVSKSISLQTLSNNELIIKTVEYSTQLMLVPLKAQLAGEDPIEKTMSDGSLNVGMHVYVDSIEGQFDKTGIKVIVPEGILSYTSYDKDSVFQLFSVSNTNPYDFGYDLALNTKTLSTSFYDPSGSAVSIANLPAHESVQMYMFDETVPEYAINSSGLVFSAEYNPLDNNFDYTQSSELEADTEFEATIPLLGVTGVAVNIQVRVNYTAAQSTAKLSATLYKNGVAYSNNDANENARPLNINREIMEDSRHDHRAYTFYVPPGDITEDDAFKVRVKTTASAPVFIGTYNTKCEYFDIISATWKSDGCVPQADSTPTVISCICDHLTSFGGALFVSPDEIDFTDLTSVDIASNPVAVITCSVVLGLYIIIVIACRRMDVMDVKRISLIPLCGKDGSFKYEVTIVTGRHPGAGTSAHVGIRLIGEYGKSARQHVSKAGAFQRNCSDTFIIAYDVNLGDLQKLHIWHDNTGQSPSWYLDHVIVNDLQTDQKYYFFAHKWFSLEMEKGTIDKEIKVAGSREMNRFGHRMSTALFNSLADKHLWVSLLNRPAQSRFTRVQRATCCVTILFVFIGVNAMWYGLLKKDNTDLGWTGFGWEEIVLGLVSNVMVLPFSIGLVFLFKKSRSKANLFEHHQKPQTAQTLEIENLCGNSQAGSFESSNTGAVPYDLERESTLDSNIHMAENNNLGGLRRTRNVIKTHRENTDDSLIQPKRPSVAVTNASSKSPLWNEDGIMKWPDQVPRYDGEDSRPSTSSTVANQPVVRQPPGKAGGSTPGAARKSKTLKTKEDAGQLLEYLDQLETDLKQTESKSIKSSGSKKSTTSLRKPSMQKWGSLEDIMHSDDESVAESGKRGISKRGSTVSQSSTVKKFNPRADPRIQGNGSHWPKSRESVMSGTTRASGSFSQGNGHTTGLRPGYYSEMTMESRDIQIPIHKEKCSLPPWCIYIAYVLCFLLSAFAIVVVVLYCFQFGYEESVEWVLAFILSLVMSVFIIEPLKAFLIAVYVVAVFKNVEQDEDDDYINIEPTFDNSNEKIKDVKFKPISGFALLQAKEEGRKIHRMNVMIRQFVAYIFYLWLLMVIVYVHFHYNSYLLTKHVEHDFMAPTTMNDSTNFTSINTIDEFWDWTENVFVDSLYLEDSLTDEEHGFLMGAPRARLIRGLTSSCWAASAAERLGASTLTDRICHGEGQYDEDTSDYSEGWNDSISNGSWRYNSAGELGSTHKIGHVATYPGGGYPQVLGTSYYETLSIIQDLKTKGWIDLLTRAVIIEFSLYSPGTDMTSTVVLLAEFPLTGGVITSYEIQSQKLMWFQYRTVDPLMVLQSILLIVVVYSWIHQALQIREHGKQFFKDLWNYYEMLTTLMATVSIGMYIGCVIEATNTFNTFIANQTDFTNFERVTYVHVGTRYLQAWLLFLLMYKVVKQMRFVKFMHIYEKTLSNAVFHLLGTALIFIILLLAYAQVGYLMYGRIVDGFESVGHTIMTLIVMIRGSFDFWPMLDHHPIFSHFYVYSYYAFAYGIMVALVISILQSTYKMVKSQKYYKATLEMQDYEMVDFMLKRFKLWAGIQKPKPAFRRVRFPGLPSISSRSSSSYSNRSSASLQSAQSISDREFSQVQLTSMMARLTPTWHAVLKRMEKIEALDKEEESLVKKAENEMKDLNWKCRINELERQTKEILNWKNPSTSSKTPAGDVKQQRQSILKRLAKDNQDRKAPATVSGATTRIASTPNGADSKTASGRRPFSDQGARVEQPSTSQQRRASSQEKSTLQKFFKSVKPSKAAWNK